jgi:hypothetical protein
MKYTISFKAVTIGAIVNVLGIFLIEVLFVIYFVLNTPDKSESLLVIKSQTPLIVLSILAVIMSVVGGYVAARLAKHHEILHGAFSSWICILIALVSISIGTYPILWVLMGIVTNPLLGMIGGYLRLLQQKK